MSKSVSKRFLNLMEDPMVKVIIDRNSDITTIIDEVSHWWSYDLYNRKPGPAYLEDGTFIGTDLDMVCFLYELAKRGAAINIPEYKSFRQTKLKEGQMLTSKENRHGLLRGLISNKETWIFSINIIDQNVMVSDGTGDFRTFSLTDFNGDWYDGWKDIQFIGTAKENEWLMENKLLTENRIIFKHFIHPNRWTSFFGVKYFITKLLLQRMTEEAQHIFQQLKAMKENGIGFPKGDGTASAKSYPSKSDKGKQIKVTAFEVELDVPENDTVFPEYEQTPEMYKTLYNKRNQYISGVGSSLRFMTRATEFAHFKNPNRFPHWIQGAEWINDYKQKGKKKLWKRLVLCQPEYFKTGIALRKRTYEKSTRVSEDYNK